jgi:hypothetical protein
MRTVLVLAFGLVLLAVAPAAAQAAAFDRSAVRSAGLSVTWPVKAKGATLAPGSAVEVLVRRTGHASRGRVVVSLTRVSARGRALELVARRYGPGRFATALPNVWAGRFALVLRVGRRSWRTIIRTSAQRPVVVPPAPKLDTPAGPSTGMGSGCATEAGTPSASVALARTTARAGETVPFTLENTGTACLVFGVAYTWQRLAGAGWQDVPCPEGGPCVVPLLALSLPPGMHYTADATVYSTMTPGRYRLVKPISTGGLRPNAELDVVG